MTENVTIELTLPAKLHRGLEWYSQFTLGYSGHKYKDKTVNSLIVDALRDFFVCEQSSRFERVAEMLEEEFKLMELVE